MLKALMEYIGGSNPNKPLEQVNGFSLIKSDVENHQLKSFYLCLGRHELFLVPRPNPGSFSFAQPSETTTAPADGGMSIFSASHQPALQSGNKAQHTKQIIVLSYTAIDCVMRSLKEDQFQIILKKGTLKRYKHAQLQPQQQQQKVQLDFINVWCAGEREQIIQELLISIKASHMFFTFEIHTDEIVFSQQQQQPQMTTAKEDEEAKEMDVIRNLWRQFKSKGGSRGVSSSALAMLPTSIASSSNGSSSNGNSSSSVLMQQPLNKVMFQGYTFYKPAEYEESIKSGTNKKQFDKPFKAPKMQQLELGTNKTNLRLDCASLRVERLEPSGERILSVASICERYVKEICSHVSDWKLREKPFKYEKKNNLNADIAQWECYCIKIRTLKARSPQSSMSSSLAVSGQTGNVEDRQYEFRHITVVSCRRNFIPPTMQSHADFLIVHVSQYQDFDEAMEEEVAQLVCDSLSAESKISDQDKDELVLQCTCDALLLDNPSYGYYETQLRVKPKCFDKAREFCRTLFDFLYNQDLSETLNFWQNEQERDQAMKTVLYCDEEYDKANIKPTMTTAAATSGKVGRRFNSVEEVPAPIPVVTANSSSQQDLATKIFNIAEQMETSAPGLDPENESNKQDWASWRIRVWRYLAYCVDSHVYRRALDVEFLVRCWKNCQDKSVKRILAKVLDKFLHLRQIGEEYKPDEFPQKASSERLMSSCTFNERVLIALLKFGYIQQVLSAHSHSLYPKFLVRLLCRQDDLVPSTAISTGPSSSSGERPDLQMATDFTLNPPEPFDPPEPLAHAILKCLVIQSSTMQSPVATKSSTAALVTSDVVNNGNKPGANGGGGGGTEEEKAHDVALNILVPALIRIFMNHPEDDKLRCFVIAILVNFSRNNYSVKANILAGGFAREIVKLLRSKDDDLVRHACSLLTNLTKTTDSRITIYRGNTKLWLLDLIKKNPIHSTVLDLPSQDRYRSSKIISQCCQVVGNLAIDPTIRADLLREEEIHNVEGQFPISTLVKHLCDLVYKEEYIKTFPKSKSGASVNPPPKELDEVRASALFALKNLSISAGNGSSGGANGSVGNGAKISSSHVKIALARYASKEFLAILKDKNVRDRNLIDYMLRLLYSLCYEPKVCAKLQAEKISEGLALRKPDFPNLCVQIQQKIANYQKNLTSSASEEEPATVGVGLSTFESSVMPPSSNTIQGGILKQSRFSKQPGS